MTFQELCVRLMTFWFLEGEHDKHDYLEAVLRQIEEANVTLSLSFQKPNWHSMAMSLMLMV